jgi:hypothetical protein
LQYRFEQSAAFAKLAQHVSQLARILRRQPVHSARHWRSDGNLGVVASG